MEIYMVEGSGSSEELKPLYFNDNRKESTDIYVEDEFFSFDEIDIKEDSVEKYFNIEVDNEIPNHIICKYVSRDMRQGIYGNYLECQDDRKFILNPDEGVDDDEC